MSKLHHKHASKPRAQLRKSEYEVDDQDWIKALLARGTHGTLATVYEEQPFITPILFFYDEDAHAVYFHGARTGRLRANLEFNPKVAFNISEFGRILPHQEAAEFNVEYNSVVVFGRVELVDDLKKAERILQQLLNKYAPHLKPGRDYRPIQFNELKITAVYKINIEEWSGKRQSEPEDYPGAFDYQVG